MLYLVTTNPILQDNINWGVISAEESLSLMQDWKLYQFDTETSGRDSRICEILCAQFGNDSNDIRIVVDCTTVDITLYKDFMETRMMIGQNLKFDLQFLYNKNIIVRNVYDVMIVEQLLHLGYPPYPKPGGISYALNAIALRYLGINIDKTVRGEIIWRGLDESVILYAAGDVTYLEQIMWKQVAECKNKGCLVGAKIECSFVPVIAYLEWCGIKLDAEKWKDKMNRDAKKLEERKNRLDSLIAHYSEVGFGQLSAEVFQKYVYINYQGDLFEGFDLTPKCLINWSSQQQVLPLFQLFGFETTVKDKKTGEDKNSVLEKVLKGQRGLNDEFLDAYFDYQESAKVVSTYGQGHLDCINPITNRIHTTYKQLGAASGRMSCGSTQPNTDLARLKQLPAGRCRYPNIQQLPSDEDTRSCFVAEEGNKFCSCDYSAIESRLGGDIYQDQAILDEFLLRSGDMHSLVAKMIFPELKDVPIEDIKKKYPDLRKRAKPVEFSQQFGGSEYAIASSLGCSIDEAKEIKRFYDTGFKGVTKFKRIGSRFVRDNGYVLICKYTGHKMYWYDWSEWAVEDITDPDVRKRHYKVAAKWDRMALNAPTQGTGAIILKFAMIQLFNWIVENGYFGKVKIVALVHDECCIEYPEEILDMPKTLEHIMEEAATKFCKSLPVPAEAAVGDHWIH